MKKYNQILSMVAGSAMLSSPLTANATQASNLASALDAARNNVVVSAPENQEEELILFTEDKLRELIAKYTCPKELEGRTSSIHYLHDQDGDGIPDQRYIFEENSCENDGLNSAPLKPYVGQKVTQNQLNALEKKLVVRPTNNVRNRHKTDFRDKVLNWDCVEDSDEERIKRHLSGKDNLTITQAIAQGVGIYNFDSRPLEIMYSCAIPEAIAEKIEPEIIPLSGGSDNEGLVVGKNESKDFYVPLMSSVGTYPSHVSFNGENVEVIAMNSLGYPMGGKINYTPAKPAETMSTEDVFESHTQRLLENDLSKWVASNLFSMDFYKEFEGDLCTEEVDKGCFTQEQYTKAGSIMAQLLVDKYKSQQGNSLEMNSEENISAKAHQTFAGYLSPVNNITYYYTNGTGRSLSDVLSESQNTINCNTQKYTTAKEYFDCGLAQAAQIHVTLDESLQSMYSSQSITPMNIPVIEQQSTLENNGGEK